MCLITVMWLEDIIILCFCLQVILSLGLARYFLWRRVQFLLWGVCLAGYTLRLLPHLAIFEQVVQHPTVTEWLTSRTIHSARLLVNVFGVSLQAQHLEGMGHCATAMPDTLLEALQNFDASKLLPYEAGDAQGIVAAVDRHMSR